MLTSLYYYGLYKPYMIRETGAASRVAPTVRRSVKTSEAARAQSVLLNKALKSDVVTYAREASFSVTGLRGAAGKLVNEAEVFGRKARAEGLDGAQEAFAKRAEDFVEVYNKAHEFTQAQEHSESLRMFGVDAAGVLEQNDEALSAMGFAFDAEGKLQFDRSKMDSMDAAAMQWALGDAESTFKEVYDLAQEVLKEPLANHMHFKGLRFYYNYKMGAVQDNTFKMIEAGMIADYAV